MKRLTVLLLLPLFFLSCGSDKERLHLYNWTYYIPYELLVEFEKKFDIKIILDSYDSNEMMYARLAAGNASYDLAVPSSDYASLMIQQQMIQPFDHNLLPNFSAINSSVLALAEPYDPGNRYTIPYFLGTTGITVNTKYIKDFTEGWQIFADERYKNRMTLMNDPREVLGGALKTLGYSINSTNIDEIEAAKNLVLTWQKNILKFDAETFGKDFANENVYVVHGYAEVVKKELDEDQFSSTYFFIPQEGSVSYLDSFVFLANSTKKEAVHKFVNFMLEPASHAYVASSFYYPTIIDGAEELRTAPAAYNLNLVLQTDSELRLDVGAAITYYNKAWNDIISQR